MEQWVLRQLKLAQLMRLTQHQQRPGLLSLMQPLRVRVMLGPALEQVDLHLSDSSPVGPHG